MSYTVTATASLNAAPYFVFKNVGNVVGGSSGVTGTITFSINNGAAQTINSINSGLNGGGNIATNDVYFITSLPGVNINDIVTLASGTLTTTTNVAAAAPASGAFTTFLFDKNTTKISNNGVSGGAAAPEPGTLSLVGMGLVSGMGTLGIARKRRKNAAV